MGNNPNQNFNPRSPYGERPAGANGADGKGVFQSTLPLRGATQVVCFRNLADYISIHAPLTGSDRKHDRQRAGPMYFNPRSPYGERLSGAPARLDRTRISIHAPLTGSDCRSPSKREQAAEFQSTLPLRGATGAFSLML